MVFTSYAFAIFFAIVLILLWLMPNKISRQVVILVASIYFYSYWEPIYLLVLATPSIIDYICATRIEDANDHKTRRHWLRFSIVTNLGLLGYFKYANFFIDNFSSLLGIEARHLNVALPIGISFFTFKTLSYTIDVYRGELKACRSVWRYAMFITYFPELVAGPIVRASVFLPQMTRSLSLSWGRTAVGMQIILVGVTKKIVIADRLAPFADAVFAHPELYSQPTVFLAVVAYSLQIYCDFSGYSDMAIGISRIIGFDLPENFNMPYASTSITEFWRRWHITLSTWLRDYLYIPLGGNRNGKLMTYRNLFITMLLGGLWHGASWTFVVWGALHGIGLAVHKLWMEQFPQEQRKTSLVGRFAGWLGTYCFVCLAWIFFRAQTFGSAFHMIKKIVGVEGGGEDWFFSPLFVIIPFVALGHFIGLYVAGRFPKKQKAMAVPVRWKQMYANAGKRFAFKPHAAAGIYPLLPLPGFAGGFLICLWTLVVFLFAVTNSSPFIYFQF